MEPQEWWKPCIAEFVGAFALTFVGAGAIIATGAGNLVAIALAHGLAIAVMVMAVGHISGGHFNPAVTAAAMFTKKIGIEMGLLYIIFQLLGALFGAFLLVVSTPDRLWQAVNLGTPQISSTINAPQAVMIEAVLTFFLVFVIFGVAIDNRNHARVVGGLAIGFVIAMDILMGGPFTGAAMNPARAFGPALLSKTFQDQLVYWVGPLLGGIIAGLVYDNAFLQKPAKRDDAAPEPIPPQGAMP